MILEVLGARKHIDVGNADYRENINPAEN